MARRCDITWPDSYVGSAKRYTATCKTSETIIEDYRQAQEPNWNEVANRIRNEVLSKYPNVKVYHVWVDYLGRDSRVIKGKDIDRTVYTYNYQVNVEFHDSPIAPLLAIAIILIIAAVLAGFITIISYNLTDVWKQEAVVKTIEAEMKKQVAETGQQILSTQGYDAYLKWLEAQTKLAEAQKTGQQLSDVEQAFQKAIFYIVLLAGVGIAIYIVYLLVERYAHK